MTHDDACFKIQNSKCLNFKLSEGAVLWTSALCLHDKRSDTNELVSNQINRPY
jgi:hypothetical protein